MSTRDSAVYKVTSPLSSYSYYGYGPMDTYEKVFLNMVLHEKDNFIIKRGADMLFNEAKRDKDNIDIELIDVCIDEEEALCSRNDHRSTDSSSITGPTLFPQIVARKAIKKDSNLLSNWKNNRLISTAATARKAYKHGAYTHAQITALATSKLIGQQVVIDLDQLTPQQFSTQYNLPITYKK